MSKIGKNWVVIALVRYAKIAGILKSSGRKTVFHLLITLLMNQDNNIFLKKNSRDEFKPSVNKKCSKTNVELLFLACLILPKLVLIE